MTSDRPTDYLASLLHELCALPCERFGIEPANKAVASRLIREALEAGMIRLVSEQVADKLRAYVPFWA